MNMLQDLLAYLQSPDLAGDPFVRVDAVAFPDGDGVISLSVRDYHGDNVWTDWEVRAVSLRDFRIQEPWGELWLEERDHVVARQHTDTQQQLFFRGQPPSVVEAVARLFLAHRDIARRWISFDRYINMALDLEVLLGQGFGMLADGPSFLVQAYARVLEREGVRSSLLEPRPPKVWDGHSFVEWASPLATLIIGESYFVAESFAGRRLERHSGQQPAAADDASAVRRPRR